MKIEAILGLVMAEIDRAEKLHPVWPTDLVKAAAIPVEEAGELLAQHDEQVCFLNRLREEQEELKKLREKFTVHHAE